MPYADNQGVRIHYGVAGEGVPLVLQHGFTQCIEDWHEAGYVEALKSDFQLILVDARGHGASDKPHDAGAYPLDKRASDVVAVLDALGVEKAHFWGYSMGSWIALGMAKYAPQRVGALVVGGGHPYARDQSATRSLVSRALAGGETIGEGGGGLFVASQSQMHQHYMSAALRERWLNADLNAYLALSLDRPSLEDAWLRMDMPCCLYVGEADPLFAQARDASRLNPRVTFFSLPGLDHVDGFYRTDIVLPRVVSFLRGS
jgi:pimeloyl-ACP methyl ester carboxylesterase